jgi:DNA (cytosine-5)-methyltransferase 1
LLDLFCGAGGAAVGYHRAGFEVVGVDIVPQPRYPFEFRLGHALEDPDDLASFDAVHASPPCQAYSRLRRLPWLAGREYWDSVPPTLEKLATWGLPWVVENVPGSGLQGVTLCGLSFGLPTYRHRVFAASFLLMGLPHLKHRERIGGGQVPGAVGTVNASSARGAWRTGGMVTVAGHQFCREDGVRALGVEHMTCGEMAQAIPPAYTQFVGGQLLRVVGG